MMSNIINAINGVFKKVVVDFNASFVNQQNQIDDMKKTTDESMQTMANLKRQLNQRDFIIDDQNSRISSLRDTLERNETYSRRDNLIFGGISQTSNGTCTEIVYNIIKNKLHMNYSTSINFVRCHYLSNPTADRKGTIIARFQLFSQRMLVWNKRRELARTGLYLSEDFPSEISRNRSKLRPILKEASKHTQYERCISLKYDQLCFQGKSYSTSNLHSLPSNIHPRTLSEKRSKDLLCFGGILSEYHELSNFYKCNIKFQNVKFSSLEQCYQWCKATLFDDDRTAHMIMKSTSPSEMKQLGRNVSGFDAAKWNRGKEQLMRNLVHEKFSQNHHLLQKLCSTGTLHLAECTQSDTYYGTGISISNPKCMQKNNWPGNNMLGIILMDIRKDLSR